MMNDFNFHLKSKSDVKRCSSYSNTIDVNPNRNSLTPSTNPSNYEINIKKRSSFVKDKKILSCIDEDANKILIIEPLSENKNKTNIPSNFKLNNNNFFSVDSKKLNDIDKEELFSRQSTSKFANIFSENKNGYNGKHKKMEKMLENVVFSVIVNLFTVYALFGDDLRILIMPKSVDIYFNMLIIFCILSFFTEIFLSIFTKEEYLFSFFFWLDVLSTLTLILDFTWIHEEFSSSTFFH